MKLPSVFKNFKQKHVSEKGSVTLFVLIAMLFFLIIGMTIFIINMNAKTSQKKDVEKIKSEYNSNTSETDLETMYQEAKQRQLGKFVIKVIDSYKAIYNSEEWINDSNKDRLPLTIDANWPAGVACVEIVDHTGTGIRVNSEKALEDIIFGKENTPEREGQYQITAKVDNVPDTVIQVKIDLTAPTVTSISPNGGTVWKGTEEETIQAEYASNIITLSASDNVSGIKEIQYIINNSSVTPSAEAAWQTYNESSKPEINNAQENGEYYIHVRAIDNAGNVSEVTNSEPYYVRQANYKVTTVTNGIKYASTLEEATGIDGAEVIKVLRTFTDEVAATINKNVTIDTNGKTLSVAEKITVVSGKTATFVDTAETKGTLQRVALPAGVDGGLIENNGSVIVNGAILKSKDNTISYGNITVNSGKVQSTGSSAVSYPFALNGNTQIKITGGEITGNDYSAIRVINKCEIEGGTIHGNQYGIVPETNAEVIVKGATTNINGVFSGIASNYDGVKIKVENGTIEGTSGTGIDLINRSNNEVIITGGRIKGQTDGISEIGANSTVTIGDNTTNLDRTSPVITGSTGIGISIEDATATLNFYDGTIIGGTKATAAEGKRTFYGREMAFDVVNGATVNFRNGYKPYTRQNTETNKFETVLEKQVNVTFNPGQGVTVAENSRNVLTNVEYKEKAETAEIASLPTPTKTGYTFKGWNGKNLFNEDGIILSIPDAQYENGYYIFDSNKAHETYTLNYLSLIQGQFKVNTQYTFSILGYTTGAENNNLRLRAYYKSGNTTYSDFNLKEEGLFTFTTEPNETIDRLIFSYVSNTSVHAKFIQLEQGSTATSYEPYYITDNTKVVQDQDHTLNAIWEANKYTVHFDKNDSNERPAVGEMSDLQMEYDKSQNLPANEFVRIGYKFNGWNTAADGSGTSYADVASISNLTTSGTITLYAQWIAANATFIEGQSFNVIAKKLAGATGTVTHSTADTTITRIKYAGIGSGADQISLDTLKTIKQNAVAPNTITGETQYVKVSDDTQSNTPIYVWFDNGTLYWFSEDDTPSLNQNAANMFNNMQAVTAITELNKIDTSKATTLQALFQDCRAVTSLDLSNFETTNVIDMSYMFHNCLALTTLDVSSLETQNVETMAYMFAGSTTRYEHLNTAQDYRMNLTSITGLDRFNTSKVTNMCQMFRMCTKITSLDLRSFDTQNVTDFSIMFAGSWSDRVITMALNDIKGLENFNTSKAENMASMFAECSNLTQINISGFNTSKVTDMQSMFLYCIEITDLDLSNFDTRKVTNMSQMFMYTFKIENLDLRSFDTSKVTAMSRMFVNSKKLKTIYATDKFVVNNGTATTRMFDSCTKLVGGSGTPYDENIVDGIRAKVDEGPTSSNPGYFTNHYAVSFDANSGTGLMAPQSVPYNRNCTLNTCTFTKTGYTFAGWATSANGDVVISTSDNIINSENVNIKPLITNNTITLYAKWTPRTDTPYVVNYYVHDLGTQTYTLKTELTDNLQGTSDATLQINNLKKTIAGYTFETAYTTGNTTKPADGAVTETTISADGTRVINMYYRPNYLYVQHHVNTGSFADKHGANYGVSDNLITNTLNTTSTNFLRGVYGSKVGGVTLSTYAVNAFGLLDYNSQSDMNILKTGYRAKSKNEWNTSADGTGTSFNQSSSNINAIDMATACGKDLSTGDQVITLYVNWEPIPYTISYELNNGINNTQNPSRYTIETADITLQTPTRNGYTFTNWNEEVSNMYWTYGFLNLSTGVHEKNSTYPNSYYTAPIKLKQGVTYTLSGYGAYAAGNIRWRLYNTDGSYYKNGASTNTYTAEKDCYVRIMFFSNPSAEQRNGTILTSSAMETIVISQGNTGNRKYTANWTEKTYTLTIKPNGGELDGSITDIVRNLKYSDVSDIHTPTKTGYTFSGWNELSVATFNNELADVANYSNQNKDQISVTSQPKSQDNPISGTTNELVITNAGTAGTKPGLGGFVHRKTATANSKYVHVFVAKLPVGYWFHNANNTIGTGGTTEWLTSNEGTGEWQTYIYKVNAGSSGNFSTFGHVYVSAYNDNTWTVGVGSKRNETGAYTAYLAYSNIFDITADESGIGQIDGTGVLTANWTANNYKVHFNKNDEGATGEMPDQSFTYGETQNLTANAFSKTGYSVAGWATSANGEVVYQNQASVSNLTTEKDGTVNLYAVWEANNYTVTADSNGGAIATPAAEGWTNAGDNKTAIKSVTYDSAYGTLPTLSARTGYAFQNWTGKNLFDEETKLMAISGATKENGYYVFNPLRAYNLYSIAQNGIKDLSFKENAQYTIQLEGYTDYLESVNVYESFFIGFYYTDGTYTRIDISGPNNTKKTLTSNNNKKIDRIFTSYGRGLGNVYIKNIQVEEGAAATDYEPYQRIENANIVNKAENHTIFASWRANEYTLTANANGGSIPATTGWTGNGATATKSVMYNHIYYTLPEPTREGYTFEGWYKEQGFTNQVTRTSIYDILGESTIYAKWTANTYTVSFDPNGGTPTPADKTVTFDSLYGTMPEVSKTGYTLKGWNGKNLFNVENVIDDYYIQKSNGQPLAYSSAVTPWSCSDYIEIEGGKTYTFNPNSSAGSSDTAHALYDENKVFISAVSTGKQTITTPSNAKYIRVSYRRSNSSYMQLEEGNVATSFEPYSITADTIVKTPNDHTLTALWEAIP